MFTTRITANYGCRAVVSAAPQNIAGTTSVVCCLHSDSKSKDLQTPKTTAAAAAAACTKPNGETTALSGLVLDVQSYRNASGDLLKKKWNEAYSFYEQFSHMDEVREAHDKVVDIQNALQQAQQRRTDLLHELNFVRKEQKMLHGEMANCSRSDIRYLDLVKLEIEVNQREREKLDAFNTEDQRERNLFTHLTAAVKASHEKEKIYANTVKYWSYIGTILGAVIGVAGSALSYHYRQNTYKTITDQYTEQVLLIEAHIEALQTDLVALRNEIQAARVVQQRALDMAVRTAAVARTRTGHVEQQQKQLAAVGESWSSYLYRKTVGIYRWVYPRASVK